MPEQEQDSVLVAGERNDGVLANAMTGLGTSKDRNRYTYVSDVEVLGQDQLETLYIGSWLMKRIVDTIPSEATRLGWDLALGSETAKARRQSDQLVAAGEKLRLRRMVRRAACQARLQGGAVLLMIIEDGAKSPAEPVNRKGIKRIRGLHVLDRWQIWPAPGWKGVGEPELYEFNSNNDSDLQRLGMDATAAVQVHRSRLLRFEGEEVPWRLRPQFNWWGTSVLQAVVDVFFRYETGQQAASGILHDFDLFVHKIPGLAGMIAAGNQEAISSRLEAAMLGRSVYRGLVLDANEEAAFATRTAAGVADVLSNLKGEITGASRLPHTKLWGESPSGLGATGESESGDFAMDVADWQEEHLQAPLRQFYELLMLTKEGPYNGAPPEDWKIAFRPTQVMAPQEEAAYRQAVASADSTWINAGVLSPNEVALARFGRPEFSLDTTLIDREADGSIRQEEEQDYSNIEVNGMAPGEQEQVPGEPPPGQAPGGGGLQGQEATDSADEPCCEACGRGEKCESDCDGSDCPGDDEEEEDCDSCNLDAADKEEDDPGQHDHPDKVGQVMHRWKYGTLHSGTGRKGEHRNALQHGKGSYKQAVAIALSIAGEGKPPARRRRGRVRPTREDAAPLQGRLAVAGVTVDVGTDGTGPLIGPYGDPTPYQAVVGPAASGAWEVLDSATGEWFAVVGVEDRASIAAVTGEACRVRRLDSIDWAAMGIRCDAYEGEE